MTQNSKNSRPSIGQGSSNPLLTCRMVDPFDLKDSSQAETRCKPTTELSPIPTQRLESQIKYALLRTWCLKATRIAGLWWWILLYSLILAKINMFTDSMIQPSIVVRAAIKALLCGRGNLFFHLPEWCIWGSECLFSQQRGASLWKRL